MDDRPQFPDGLQVARAVAQVLRTKLGALVAENLEQDDLGTA